MTTILIADDEKTECVMLSHILSSQFEGLNILPFAYDGVTLLNSIEKNHPDVVIADICMPGLTGLKVIDFIRMKGITTHIIINSAYSNFDYMQEAMRLGVSGYILKPCRQQDIINVVGKVIAEVNKQHSEENRHKADDAQMAALVRIAEQEFMASLILGKVSCESLAIVRQNRKVTSTGGFIAAVIPEPSTAVNDVLADQIEKLISQEMNQYCSCMSIRMKNIIYLYLNVGKQTDESNYLQWAEDMGNHMISVINKKFSVKIRCAFSAWKSDDRELPDGIQESQIIAPHDDEVTVYCYKKYTSVSEKWKKYIETILSECTDSESLFRKLQELKSKLSTAEIDLNELRIIILNTCMSASDETIFSQLIRKYSKTYQDYWNELGKCVSTNDIIDWMSAQLPREDLTTDNNQYVLQALDYMEKNFSRDISLDLTAHETGISPFYLARLLKEDTGKTFTEILTEIRIRKAIQLLKDKKNTSRQIGQMVGYENTTYFYKVFKKATGMTVGELRQFL